MSGRRFLNTSEFWRYLQLRITAMVWLWESLQYVTARSSRYNWMQLTLQCLLCISSQRSWEAIVSSFSFVICQEPVARGIYKASSLYFWRDRELSTFTDICIYLWYWANTWIFISLYEKDSWPQTAICLLIYTHLRIAKVSTMFIFIITCSYQDFSSLSQFAGLSDYLLHLLLQKLGFSVKLF